MALNIEKIGKPVCKVVGGRYNNKQVSVCTNDEEEEESSRVFTSMALTDGKFQQIPDTTADRQILYITAPSGAGKSGWGRCKAK